MPAAWFVVPTQLALLVLLTADGPTIAAVAVGRFVLLVLLRLPRHTFWAAFVLCPTLRFVILALLAYF